MNTIGWYFPPLNGASLQGAASGDKEMFKGSQKIDNLTKEVIQNSLDAHDKNSADPVKVSFKTISLPIADYRAISEYRQYIDKCSDFWGDDADPKLRTMLANATKVYDKDTITCMVISDYHTTGAGKSGKLISPWTALTGANGMSIKTSDTSGGSYGIGKNACFVCSDLSVVFYNTLTADKKSYFMGVAKLATLKDHGQETHAEGRYRHQDFSDIEQDGEDDFRDLFKREEPGTDIIIPAFSEPDGYQDTIAKAAIRSFYVAIKENKLIVELNEKQNNLTIDASNIDKILQRYAKRDEKMAQMQQFSTAYNHPTQAVHASIFEKDDFDIRIVMLENGLNTTMYFRNNGMCIETPKHNASQNYAGIAVARGAKLSSLLRDMEAPNHNKWDPGQIEDKKIRKKASDTLKKMHQSINDLLYDISKEYESQIMNADDVAMYLPSGSGVDLNDGNNVDYLRPDIRILNTRIKAASYRRMRDNGSLADFPKGIGMHALTNQNTPTDNSNPDLPEDGKTKQHFNADVDAHGEQEIIINPDRIRAFPLNADLGIYKLIWYPERDYKHLAFSFNSLGEDGASDSLKMSSFTENGQSIMIRDNGKSAEYVDVSGNSRCEFIAQFEQTGKMALEIQILEKENTK